MKLTVKRVALAGAIGLATIATPISLSVVLPGVGNSPASPATPANPDTVVYSEGKGNSSNFIAYVPGDGGKSTTESVTAGGGCSSPTIHGVPLLNLAGFLYPSGAYMGSPSAAIVGAFQGRTGVCAITPDWAINNGGTSGAEALDFGVGTNTLVAGRLFADAQLVLEGESGSGPISVELVESLGGAQTATQLCTISSSGADITADTQAPSGGACTPNTGDLASPFDTVEVRVLTSNASVSVVGPTSTFTMASEICGGQSIQSTGPVSATLSLPANAPCKSYTAFSSGPNSGGQEQLNFNGYSAGPVPFTVTITWPAVPECQPNSDPVTAGNPSGIPADLTLPVCAVTQFSLDGTTWYDQTYCQGVSPTDPPQSELCTTNKTYNNVNPANGSPILTSTGAAGTQIVETWVGDVDWNFR
ncbi:MAG TPA: hypothetical protein VG244_02975 [Acidimicrobiales bacterium]|jgi:hypothetical protein|nr:hypothetical protein [Acidimicrobiales bacterium]